MNWRHILLLTLTTLYGCQAGRAVMITPRELNAESYCGVYTIRPDGFLADGFMVLYYIVPLAFGTGESETKTSLEFPITIHSKTDPIFDLTLQDMQIRIPGIESAISPARVEVTEDIEIPNKPWYYKTFKYTFEVDRHKLNEFTLVFPRPVHGCALPDTAYLIKEERHYISPINR